MPDMKKGALTLCLSALACGAMDAGYARSVLDRDALLSGSYRRSVDLSAYSRPEDAAPPSNRFEGRLRLSGQPSTRTLVVLPDYLGPDDALLARTLPQDFDYEFVQTGESLIPVRRGPIASSHPWWEFVLEPGRVWDETGDDGYTRAAIPFALVQKNANCTHNGVLMILFKDSGAVSRAALQVSSETCHYLQLDMWGTLEASYEPGKVADSDGIVAAYEAEVARRMPSRPLSALRIDHPGVDPSKFTIGAAPGRTVYGLVFEGVHYRSGCATRHGQYPYCDVLDIPSYSVAKSVVAGLAFMRMERLHPGTEDLQVNQFAPATGCRSEKWRGVTFRHLLDMTTGQYDAPTYMADEDNVRVRAFFAPSTHAQRLAYACEAYPRNESPGSRWVYHTSDTYLLGTVLQEAWRRLPRRAHDDVFDDLLWADVFGPLGLSPTARATRRSDDEARQAFFGWGLTLHADDIAKLARFLGQEQGSIRGRELLDTAMFEAAMQRDPDNPGLTVATLDRYRYQHGFWARNLEVELGCDRPTWVPFMSGFGGITVVLFPNGMAWYNVADDGLLASIDFAEPAEEALAFGPLCRK
ncbi:MAG: beta-lactamase family protein [Pseudoxanthomonas sp.]|nr:beta-lactamase family protein [Pseudoxanthomonas sp.]